MRGRKPFTVILVLLMCVSFPLSVSAQSLLPQEIILEQMQELSGGYAGEFYNKASGYGSLQITKLTGSLLQALPELKLRDCTLKFNTRLDTPEKKASFNLTAELNGKVYTAEIFLDNDKIIFGRDTLTLIQGLAPQIALPPQGQLPEYFYLRNPGLAGTWKSLTYYRDEGMPPEIRDLLRFLLEAVPDKCYAISWSQITLQLDQAAWEEFLCNLVEKVKNEKERFAGLIAGLVALSDASGTAGDPEELKAKIIEKIEQGINSGSFPTREDIHALAEMLQLKEFRYEGSLLPGGSKELKAVWDFQSGSGVTGQLEIYSQSKTSGEKGERTQGSAIRWNVATPAQVKVDGVVKSALVLQGEKANSNFVLAAHAISESTGEVLLDLELEGESVDQVDRGVEILVPELTASNSLDLGARLPVQNNAGPTGPGDREVIMFIDGRAFVPQGVPYVKDGRTMVPARELAEALGGQAEWIEPDEVRLTKDGRVISMFIGRTIYKADGAAKQMDVAPELLQGKTYIPLRFLAAEWGLKLETSSNPQVILLYTK